MSPQLEDLSVVLADDHRIVIDGLAVLLKADFDLVGTAENGVALVELAIREQPDVVVTDMTMPLLNGIDAVRKMRGAGVTSKIVFLTMHSDVVYATRALEAGATGYLLKDSLPADFNAAIHALRAGESPISPPLARLLSWRRRRCTAGVGARGG